MPVLEKEGNSTVFIFLVKENLTEEVRLSLPQRLLRQ